MDELGSYIGAHMKAVATRIPAASNALFVVNVEANLAYTAPSIERYLKEHPEDIPQHKFMMEDKRRRTAATGAGGGAGGSDAAVITAGTRTTGQNKPAMIEAVSRLLRNENIHFYKDFVVADMDQIPSDAGHPRDTICKELKGMVRHVVYRKTGTAGGDDKRPVVKYIGGKGEDRNDFVMALAINTLQHKLFMTGPNYATWRRTRVAV